MMAGTLNTPAVTDPVKANGFYSFVTTIPDDDVVSVPLKGTCGFMFLATVALAHQGMFWFRGSLASKYLGAATTVAGTGVLTGTTGTDGNTTVSTTGNTLYIENRSGGAQEYVITLMTEHAAYE